jgi:hypothetical protein
MKRYCVYIALFILIFTSSAAEIKNGYGSEITLANESLKRLDALLKENDLSLLKRIKIKDKRDRLVKFVSYFELTERLLRQFKTISPDLYAEIDSIKDCMNRSVDVYVKFVDESEMAHSVAGTTSIAQIENDKNAYTSVYGPYTVSLRVKTGVRSLSWLAHEFGHVHYQVPHLASYFEFYQNHYLDLSTGTEKGHNVNDPSGERAMLFEKRFRNHYMTFWKENQNNFLNPQALLQQILKARTVSRQEDYPSQSDETTRPAEANVTHPVDVLKPKTIHFWNRGQEKM